MSNNKLGSFKWAQSSSGSLRKNERLRLLAQAILMRMTSLPARSLRRIGISRAEAEKIDLDSIRIPDTAAARGAYELCVERSSPFLLNHCVRTYLWGALLAAGGRLQYDEELFYVASLLHDLGLTGRRQENGSCNCFAAQGAHAALQFAQRHQWPEARQYKLTDAICMHLNLQVQRREGMEAHLLHAGASLDVIGARYKEIHARNRADVLDRYPRIGFKMQMAELMKAEAKLRPESRAGYLVGLGLNQLICAAPFTD